MSRPALEVADIFRDHGPAWRRANSGHVSLEQLKVMSAIETCLMGKFRNGELATRCIGGSVDFGDLTLHYGPPLGPAISRPEVKGSFPQSRWPSGLSGFELFVGIHGAGRFRWSQVSRVRSTATRSEDLVSPRSAISGRPISAHNRCNGEQKAG